MGESEKELKWERKNDQAVKTLLDELKKVKAKSRNILHGHD